MQKASDKAEVRGFENNITMANHSEVLKVTGQLTYGICKIEDKSDHRTFNFLECWFYTRFYMKNL